MASILNIVGLSLSFAAFILIMIQVWTEFTSGMDDPRHESIYRIESKSFNSKQWHIQMARDVYKDFALTTPQIKHCALYTSASSMVTVGDVRYPDIATTLIGNDISKVMGYQMIEGVFASALAPRCVLVDKRTAMRMWGNESAMGKSITVGADECVVTGIYRDFPANSMYSNGLVMFGDYGMCRAYFLLEDGANIDTVVKSFNANHLSASVRYGSDTIRMVNLADTYFSKDVSSSKQGDLTTTIIFLSIAILIIIVAIINFINFSTSLAPTRVRSLNIRSVFGSTKSSLRVGIVYEALMFAIVSFLLALLWVDLVSSSSLAGLFKTTDVSIGANLAVVIATGILAAVVGILAGIYPAFYCTRFTPALVLNGSFASTYGGKILRNALVGIQFVISIALIIAALFIHLQNRYLLTKDLGYDSKNVILVQVPDRYADIVAEQIKGLSIVESSARFDGSFGRRGVKPGDAIITAQDTVWVQTYGIDEGFLDLIKVPIIQGRGLLPQDQGQFWFKDYDGELISVLVSRSTLRALGTAVDSIIQGKKERYRVVGVTDDVIGQSLYAAQGATMFLKCDYIPAIVARVDAVNGQRAINQIRELIHKIDPYIYADVEFYDTKLADLYRKEGDLATLITVFSLLAIVISLIGVFGLVLFETGYRRKEIGLRKINGATVGQVLRMFNTKFVWIVGVCFVIATPLAWQGVNEWLSAFPYRTPMYWWVFALALLIVLGITTLTVTIQSWRAAAENPINAIR